jgi:hypothetical protein
MEIQYLPLGNTISHKTVPLSLAINFINYLAKRLSAMELKKKLAPEQAIEKQETETETEAAPEIALENCQNGEHSGKQQEHPELKEKQNLQSVKNLYQLEDRGDKSASELFDSVSNRIRVLAGEKMSEAESREAARRFISFCQLIVDYKIQQNIQSEEEVKSKYKSKNKLANSVTDSATAANNAAKNKDAFCEKDR